MAQRVGILHLGSGKGRVSRAAEVPLYVFYCMVAASCRDIVVFAGHVLPARLASKLLFISFVVRVLTPFRLAGSAFF